jgi:hypothetical protein
MRNTFSRVKQQMAPMILGKLNQVRLVSETRAEDCELTKKKAAPCH